MGLVIIIVAFAMGWIGGDDEGIGFVTYLKLADGSVIRLEQGDTYTMNVTPGTLDLTTPSGTVINEIWQNLEITPKWNGTDDPTDPNVTINYVSHDTTWRDYPSGANLNQVSPIWWAFDSFDAPVNQTTEKEYGPHWYANAWANATIGQQPSGTYWVDTEMTIEGSYKGSIETATGYGGLQVKWSQTTLTMTVGWQGYTAFILE